MSEKENKQKAFIELIDKKVKEFKSRRIEKKRNATCLRIIIVGLSFLTTVCVGINVPEMSEPLKIIALIASALVTSVSAIEAFKNPHSIYVQYTKTVSQLYDIQSELKYRFSGSEDTWDEGELDFLFSKFMSIMAEVRECWVSVKTLEKIQKNSGLQPKNDKP